MTGRLLAVMLCLVGCAANGPASRQQELHPASIMKNATMTSASASGACVITLRSETSDLEVTTQTGFPCMARTYQDGTLLYYELDDTRSAFIVCGSLVNRKDSNAQLQNDYYEGTGYQAVVVSENGVFLSPLKNQPCTPYFWEEAQHVILAEAAKTPARYSIRKSD